MNNLIQEGQAKRNIICIYIYTFFQTFILFYAVDTLFYIQRGLNSSQYISFIIIVNIIKIIFEIPSGIIADKYGKKKMLMISTVLFFIEILLFIVSKNYIMFAITMAISGIEQAFRTGIANSIIYESLKDKKKFNKALLYNSICFDLSYMIAMILGGYIAEKYNFVSTYYLTLIPIILAFVILFGIKDIQGNNDDTEKLAVSKLEILKNAFNKLLSIKGLANIFILSSVMYSAIKIVEDSHPEYAQNIGISVFYIGIYTSLILVISIVGSYIGSNMKEKTKSIALNINSLIIGVLIMSMGILNNVYGIVCLLAIYIFSESYENVMLEHIHNKIDSKSRVTVESIYGFVYSFISIIMSLVLTVVLKFLPLNNVYTIVGIFLIVFTLICILFRIKNNYKTQN